MNMLKKILSSVIGLCICAMLSGCNDLSTGSGTTSFDALSENTSKSMDNAMSSTEKNQQSNNVLIAYFS